MKKLRYLLSAVALLCGFTALWAETTVNEVVLMGNLINRHYDDGETIKNGLYDTDYGIWSYKLDASGNYTGMEKVLGDARLYSTMCSIPFSRTRPTT